MKQKTKHVNFIFIGIAVLLLLLWNGLSFIYSVFSGPWRDIEYILLLMLFFPVLIALENLLFALKYWIFSPRSKIKTIFKMIEIILSGCALIVLIICFCISSCSNMPYHGIFQPEVSIYLAFLIIVVWIAEIVFQIVFMLKNRRNNKAFAEEAKE